MREEKEEGEKAMRDLPGDKSQTRSGLLSGRLRCAIMRVVTVGVFQCISTLDSARTVVVVVVVGVRGGTHRGDDT